ncbi:DUF805 domain-containing protein [Azospirillum sp. sgz302134]
MSWSEFLLSFKGRINRKPYWLFALAAFVLSIVVAILDSNSEVPVFTAVFNVLLIWPSLAVGVKRWHDRNKSGWWMLIMFIPLLGFLWTIVECGFLRGTEGPNRFGDSPVAPPAFS